MLKKSFSGYEFIPSGYELVPSGYEFVSIDHKFVPSGHEFVPIDHEFVVDIVSLTVLGKASKKDIEISIAQFNQNLLIFLVLSIKSDLVNWPMNFIILDS